MIEHIRWPSIASSGATPFEIDAPKRRRLTLTIHCPEPTHAGDEREALALLRELAWLTDNERPSNDSWLVDAVDTAPHSICCLTLGEYDPAKQAIPTTTRGPDWQCHGAVHMDPSSDGWIGYAMRLVGTWDPHAAEVQALMADLPILQYHTQNYRDVLITSSEALLACRHGEPEANICDAVDGLRILGLQLRSLGDYSYRRVGKATEGLDRGYFYWVLCRERLPAMWRYFHGCLLATKPRKDDTDRLGNTILNRGVRALEARDEIGMWFYAPQDNSTRDRMLYHFDYLMLLLTGMLDALARITQRAYDLSVAPRRASFWNQEFSAALHTAGAEELCGVIASPRFVACHRVLRGLRNTIHSTELTPLGYHKVGEPEGSLLRLHGDQAKDVWAAVAELGERATFGFESAIGVECEPYTCATKMIEECFAWVNAIADATEIERLFPTGTVVPELPAGPVGKRVDPDTRRRVTLLG